VARVNCVFTPLWDKLTHATRTTTSHDTTLSNKGTEMSTVFEHADLGGIRGKVVDGTVQFLGLKYASLKDRLALPQLVTRYGAGTIDASKYGYVDRTDGYSELTDQQTTTCFASRSYTERVWVHSTYPTNTRGPNTFRPRRTQSEYHLATRKRWSDRLDLQVTCLRFRPRRWFCSWVELVSPLQRNPLGEEVCRNGETHHWDHD
jgi:hypothetical protein